MCVQCDHRKEEFDRLCKETAQKMIRSEAERFGEKTPTYVLAAIVRAGHFVSEIAANELELSHIQRIMMVVDFKHTIMGHPGILWDCPTCFEEYVNIATDDECHHMPPEGGLGEHRAR